MNFFYLQPTKLITFSFIRYVSSVNSIHVKPIEIWDDNVKIVQFLEEIKRKYSLQSEQDWEKLTSEQIKNEHNGKKILDKYSLNTLKIIGNHPNKLMIFNKKKPVGYWRNKENIINFLQIIKKKEKIIDWNNLSQKIIINNGGKGLLKYHSLNQLKKLVQPEIDLKEDKFISKKFIEDFILNLKQNLDLKSPNDWNLLTKKDIKTHGGSCLLNIYSINEIKCLGCPELEISFKSMKNSIQFWKNQENIQNFLIYLKETLNLNDVDSWNLLTRKDIETCGGFSLLKMYSLYDIKCMGCPAGKLIFNRKRKPNGYWNDHKNIQFFIDNLKKEFNIYSRDDWNRISLDQIRLLGGGSLLAKYSKNEIEEKYVFPKPDCN